MALIVSFVTWSPVEVEEKAEPTETERRVTDLKEAAGAEDMDVDPQEAKALETASAEEEEPSPPAEQQLSPPPSARTRAG